MSLIDFNPTIDVLVDGVYVGVYEWIHLGSHWYKIEDILITNKAIIILVKSDEAKSVNLLQSQW